MKKINNNLSYNLNLWKILKIIVKLKNFEKYYIL
jgi:hypothetical protein